MQYRATKASFIVIFFPSLYPLPLYEIGTSKNLIFFFLIYIVISGSIPKDL